MLQKVVRKVVVILFWCCSVCPMLTSGTGYHFNKLCEEVQNKHLDYREWWWDGGLVKYIYIFFYISNFYRKCFFNLTSQAAVLRLIKGVNPALDVVLTGEFPKKHLSFQPFFLRHVVLSLADSCVWLLGH